MAHWIRLQHRFWQWIDARSPKSAKVTLGLRNIYILPTPMGLWFLVLICVLWLLGTNYQNNLILALSYLLLSLDVICIVHTYANLAGLSVSAQAARPVFAGDIVEFVLKLGRPPASVSYNLEIAWRGQSRVRAPWVKTEGTSLAVPHPTQVRGLLEPGHLLIESRFPLGLMRAWAWIQLDCSALIYPKPLSAELGTSAANPAPETGAAGQVGEDFSHLRPYQPGDKIQQLVWKVYARGQGLQVAAKQVNKADNTWLCWESFPQLPPEQRLGALCHWALMFEQLQQPYGLKLPGRQLPPDLGPHHQRLVLSALARFPKHLTELTRD